MITVCPVCGTKDVTVARDGKSTRKCKNCYHIWLPENDKSNYHKPFDKASSPAKINVLKISVKTGSGIREVRSDANYLCIALTEEQIDELCANVDYVVKEYLKDNGLWKENQ